jgi:hypothetical protein
MLGGFGVIDAADIRSETRNTTGTLVTVPAGKFLTANVVLSASISVAGTSIPTVSTAGVNPTPDAGSVMVRLNLTGLALTTVADSVETEIVVAAPPENDVTVEFTAGASGTSSASLNGFIFG